MKRKESCEVSWMTRIFRILIVTGILAVPQLAVAAQKHISPLSGLHVTNTSQILQAFLFLSALSFIPILIISVTSFTRNIVVLSLLRQALGLQQTPPNSVLISLALFLMLFTMLPTVNAIKTSAYEPYSHHKMDLSEAVSSGFKPLKAFMVRQTHESDLALMLDVARAPRPKTVDDIEAVYLIPAFMLSELKSGFEIGFIIYLPFLMIDLVVAAILMSLGMIMVPPTTISLPVKIMLFVLINGWALVAHALLESYRPV